MKATRKITKLRVNEVSLVGEGDNPHADVLILKHRQIVGVDLNVAKQRLAEVREGALSIAKALSEGGSPMDIQELQLKLEEIEKSLETASTEAATSKTRITELEGKLTAVTKERDEALVEVEKAKKKIPAKDQADGGADDPDADDEVMKGLPENVRELITKERKAREELELSINKERDEREELAEVEKVRSAGLKDADKFGKLLHRVRKGKSTPEDADTLSEFLAKAKAIGDSGNLLFTTIGKVRGGDGSDADEAEAQINEKVEAVMKAKPTLTRQAAYSEVMDANPALYDQVQKAKRAA